MGFLVSNFMIKLLAGAAIVIAVVWQVEKPNNQVACSEIEKYPGRSAVYQCPPGLNTVFLYNNTGKPGYATVTTNVQAQGWLTVPGDSETLKTLPVKLGAPVVLGPGAFMAVGNGAGLIYLSNKQEMLVSIAWDHAPNK